MIDILIVCTGNICRSPMAEGLLKQMLSPELQHKIHVHSAGTHALRGNPPTAHAVDVLLSSYGIDISGHKAERISTDLISSADLILTMEQAHSMTLEQIGKPRQHALHCLGEFHSNGDSGDISDPYGEPLAVYRSCAEIIRECLDGMVKYLLQEDANR
ncbi:MAG: low molecular weight protein arginine phosphatase [Desulfobacteraceae bacterium]|nr:low molecular weight protein arginine phosphatase [Desulfobacteraceae bacterium]